MILGTGLGSTLQSKVNAIELLESSVLMNKSVTNRSVYMYVSTVIVNLSVITDMVAAMQAFK
jgi:hypothetical protein